MEAYCSSEIKPGERARRATIADVARLCGASITTVSRAVSGQHERYRIPAATRERALEAARQLGYRPSWRAKSLASKKSWQIGMLFRYSIPEMRGIYEELLQALTDTFEKAGYHLLFVPTRGDRWREILSEQRLDGCVVAEPITLGDEDLTVTRGLPLVMVNAVDQNDRFCQVLPDDALGMRLAVDHLVELGHTSIGYLRMGGGSVSNHFSLPVRRDAFSRAMSDHGLSDKAICADEPLEQFLSRVRVGPGGVTALVLYSHTEAIKLLPLLHARGLRVPQDVSLVSFNDIFPMADLLPAFTTVSVPGRLLGEVGARALLQQIEGQPVEQRTLLPESLVVRASTVRHGVSS